MFKEQIISAGLDTKRPIRGLSDEEIAEVERSQGVELPEIYRTFLAECGRSAGEPHRSALPGGIAFLSIELRSQAQR